jgi:hypothetical protein
VCFQTRGVVLCKLCDVERVMDPRGVLDTGGNKNGGGDSKKGYIYSSS